ncbi:MAG: sugar transferase [Phycisphaerae bacterium]|nr:sugar transferase [Phycisphaerae bacterium]
MRISPRRFILLAADAICVVGAIVGSAFLRLGWGEGWTYVRDHAPSLLGSSLIFLVVFYAGGMYEQPALKRKGGSYLLPLITTAISLVLIVLVFYARFRLHIGRGILLLAGVFVFFGSWSIRHFYRLAVGRGFLAKNTLVVGEGQEAADVLRLLSDTPDAGYRVFGIVSCTKSRPGEFLEGVPILGHMSRLREFADVYAIETIIVAASLAREHALLRLLRPLRYSGVEIMDYVGLHEEVAQEIPLDHIDDEWLMNAAMNSSVIHIRKIKRMMDIVVAVAGLVLLSPVALLAMLVIRMDSRGPVLFRQRRAGIEGGEYVLYKFRTMRADAESESGAVWADRYDRRITRVGRFLRKWRIDEIPQLVNVLKGEMSLAGPRPERPEFIDTLAAAIPFYRERLLVPPGITGWAQVKYPYAASIEAARRKLQYDLYYIKHMSFFLDSLILLKTFKTIIVGLKYSEEAEIESPSAEVIALPSADPSADTRSA